MVTVLLPLSPVGSLVLLGFTQEARARPAKAKTIIFLKCFINIQIPFLFCKLL